MVYDLCTTKQQFVLGSVTTIIIVCCICSAVVIAVQQYYSSAILENTFNVQKTSLLLLSYY